MSTVVDDVDSWREAWYVKASSVATSRCPVVGTVARDHRCQTSLLFVDVVRRLWQASSSSVSTVRRRRRSLPWPTVVIVGRCRGEDQFHCWRRLLGFRLVFLPFFFYHGQPKFRRHSQHVTQCPDSYYTRPGSALVPGPLVIFLGLMLPPWLSLVWS